MAHTVKAYMSEAGRNQRRSYFGGTHADMAASAFVEARTLLDVVEPETEDSSTFSARGKAYQYGGCYHSLLCALENAMPELDRLASLAAFVAGGGTSC